MIEKIQLSKQIQKGAKQLQWIMQLGEELGRIGSIERANEEALRAIEKTNKEKMEAIDVLDGLKKKAEEIEIAIESKQKLLIAQEMNAKDKAEKIVHDARHKAEEIRNKSNDMEEASEARMASMDQCIQEERKKADEYNKRVNENSVSAITEYESIMKKIEEAKKAAVDAVRKATKDLDLE